MENPITWLEEILLILSRNGWGCLCVVSKSQPIVGYDGYPLLGDTLFEPGTQRRLGFVFLSGEQAAEIVRNAGTFYLWDSGFIGEAIVVQSEEA
ncbi:MAG: hypothetical protein WAK96_12065 [Desulfobaccales bacterium]